MSRIALRLIVLTLFLGGGAAASRAETTVATSGNSQTQPAEPLTGLSAPEAQTNSFNAKSEPGGAYSENHWLQDFGVHFFVSLPFTSLFSYVTVTSLDVLVQGKYPVTFRPGADLWMVAGLAVGASVAVALGSINRVPDQSKLLTEGGEEPETPQRSACQEPGVRITLLQIEY